MTEKPIVFSSGVGLILLTALMAAIATGYLRLSQSPPSFMFWWHEACNYLCWLPGLVGIGLVVKAARARAV
jgi:hypothetical protein